MHSAKRQDILANIEWARLLGAEVLNARARGDHDKAARLRRRLRNRLLRMAAQSPNRAIHSWMAAVWTSKRDAKLRLLRKAVQFAREEDDTACSKLVEAELAELHDGPKGRRRA